MTMSVVPISQGSKKCLTSKSHFNHRAKPRTGYIVREQNSHVNVPYCWQVHDW